MTTILLASTNAHKLEELVALFGEGGEYTFALPPRPLDVEETGTTFAENAKIKALAYCEAFNQPCLADDSGLAVDALDGRPGVFSARYAPTDAERIAKLLGELKRVSSAGPSAQFVCAMALAVPTRGVLISVEGRCEGLITEAPRGQGGFGYDPIFQVPALKKTFAELTPEEKNQVSHRALATAKLKLALAGLKL